ncbi:MAG: hypothetical protein RLZZ253_929 [Verrucomicrobiota bacterium]
MSGTWQRREAAFWCLVFPVLVGLAAISSESFWIDEAHAGFKAMQPDLRSWWRMLVAFKGSDLQIPLFMFYVWVWEKLVGHSEWALRLSNLPWFVVATAALCHGLPTARSRRAAALLLGVSPFVWGYLNEFRPYIMQCAGSALALAALLRLNRAQTSPSAPDQRPRDFLLVCAGSVVLSGSSALGMAWASLALGAGMVLVWRRGRFDRAALWSATGTLLVHGSLLLFYLWTLAQGAGATAHQRPSSLNLAFAAYEILGFAGLGPSRLDLRAQGFEALKNHWFALGVGVAVIGPAIVFAICNRWKKAGTSERAFALGYVFIPVAALLALGWVTGFRMLGRHCAPCVPLLVLLLARAWADARGFWRVQGIGLALLWLWSASVLRFAPEHRKDDYRSAARRAQEALAQKQRVWWNADSVGAIFYGVPLRVTASRHPFGDALPEALPGVAAVDWISNADPEGITPRPGLIVVSKRDIYDTENRLRAWYERNGYVNAGRIPAFEFLVPARVSEAERR